MTSRKLTNKKSNVGIMENRGVYYFKYLSTILKWFGFIVNHKWYEIIKLQINTSQKILLLYIDTSKSIKIVIKIKTNLNAILIIIKIHRK